MAIVVESINPPNVIPLPGASWARATLPGARRLHEDDLSKLVAQAYHALRDHLLSRNAAGAIVRMWNYIPAITESTRDGRNRYMAFNAGRFAAMCDWFAGPEHLARSAPAASGVGCGGDDLTIDALAGPLAGTPLQNPLQTPAVEYSPRFGPRPPCFARATRVGGLLLVSGTAAIRGEESIASDLTGQLEITLENLAALTPQGLANFQSLHVYLPDFGRKPLVAERLNRAMPRACNIVFTAADLCRGELLVEIEGVAGDSTSYGGAI